MNYRIVRCVAIVNHRQWHHLLRMTVHKRHLLVFNLRCMYISSVHNKATFLDGWTQSLVLLALAGSIGITMLILACALPDFNNWWPLIVVLFYIFSVIPTFMSRRYTQNSYFGSNACQEASIFLTMGFVISAFALPLVLARSSIIKSAAAYLTLGGNIIIFATIFIFFVFAEQDDGTYGGGF